jgi:transcription initiation factor TFIIIB Brf1 subunit/transcription initiation factor TFIIB
MGSEFACPHCDSPAVIYSDEPEEDRVVCAGCGAFLATRKQFRRLIDRREKHSEVQTSGC